MILLMIQDLLPEPAAGNIRIISAKLSCIGQYLPYSFRHPEWIGVDGKVQPDLIRSHAAPVLSVGKRVCFILQMVHTFISSRPSSQQQIQY